MLSFTGESCAVSLENLILLVETSGRLQFLHLQTHWLSVTKVHIISRVNVLYQFILAMSMCSVNMCMQIVTK